MNIKLVEYTVKLMSLTIVSNVIKDICVLYIELDSVDLGYLQVKYSSKDPLVEEVLNSLDLGLTDPYNIYTELTFSSLCKYNLYDEVTKLCIDIYDTEKMFNLLKNRKLCVVYDHYKNQIIKFKKFGDNNENSKNKN